MRVEKPILIAGVGRSGTTVLHHLLCEHARVAWLSRMSTVHPGRPTKNRAVLRAVDYPIIGRHVKKKYPPGEAFPFWERWCPGFSFTCRDLVSGDVTSRTRERARRAVAGNLTKRRNRFVAKITGWPRYGYLHAIFDDVKCIHIRRDPRAVVNSRLQESWWQGWQGPHNWNRPPLTPEENAEWEAHDRSYVALAAIEWKGLMRAFQTASDATKDAAHLLIRYEELCAEPVAVLRRAIDFCELSWTGDFETAVRGISMRDANHKWRKNLSERQKSVLEAVLADELDRYGYE